MRVPVLLATNDKYVPYCRVAIASMLEHASPENEYVVYIFHKGLSQPSVEALTAFTHENARVELRDISQYLHSAMREVKWYTQEIYYRLMAADVLPEEEKILYLDCDLIILEDVAALFAIDIGDALIAAVPDSEEVRRRTSEGIGVEVQMAFNSGVMLLNLTAWREIKLFERCIEALKAYPNIRFPDQDALAIVCSGRVFALERRWNRKTYPLKFQGVAQYGIVHMADSQKAWNSAGNPQFALYYDVAKRLDQLPPPDAPVGDWPGVSWANRRFRRLRPAWLRQMVRRASGMAWLLASAYLPGRGRYLRRVRVAVTRRCPAACEHCETLCPQCAALPEIDADRLIADLDRLFAHTRTIRELALTGGEPLSHPGMVRVLRHVLDSGHASLVIVETPGLAEPAPELRHLLEAERVYVQSHGAQTGPAPKRPVKLDETWVWADFGPFERRECSDESLYWQARACGANDWYYLEGRLYPCARMACGVALGRIPESACRFVDLRRKKSRWRIARALEKLTQPRPMEACRYCLRGTVDFLPVQPEISETHSVKG